MTEPTVARVSLDACALNLRLELYGDDRLTLGLTPSVAAELAAPATPAAIAALAARLPRLTLRPAHDGDERQQRAVERRLQGRRRRRSSGRRRSHSMAADARHVFEAHLAGARYFVTADRRILSCAESIDRRLQVRPILPMALAGLLAACDER